jgi:hypothetical protein
MAAVIDSEGDDCTLISDNELNTTDIANILVRFSTELRDEQRGSLQQLLGQLSELSDDDDDDDDEIDKCRAYTNGEDADDEASVANKRRRLIAKVADATPAIPVIAALPSFLARIERLLRRPTLIGLPFTSEFS